MFGDFIVAGLLRVVMLLYEFELFLSFFFLFLVSFDSVHVYLFGVEHVV